METFSTESSTVSSNDMPVEFSYMQFAENRSLEIEAMSTAIKNGRRNKQVSQALPRHMRRRAMSHNIKRLPRRLHRQAKHEMSANPISKRPSRKYRRRPRNLMTEYARRQRRHVWLETHIWHAKRFKMIEKWGYKIPLHPNDKSIRASYRAASQHCLLIDVSYLNCVELSGPMNNLLQGFQQITSTELGVSLDGKNYTDGTEEGNILLFKRGTYPYKAIGPVSFLWKPVDSLNSEDEIRSLWIWIHPSCYKETMLELCSVFGIDGDELKQFEEAVDEPSASQEEPPPAKMAKLSEETDSEKMTPDKVLNPCLKSGEITIKSLKDELNRYRLIGPQAVEILADAMKPASVSSMSETADKWWQSYHSNEQHMKHFNQQIKNWSQFQEFYRTKSSEHKVWSLTVKDPRLDMPSKRLFVEGEDMEEIQDKSEPSAIEFTPYSAIWDHHIRRDVTKTQMTMHQLNQKRSQLLVPGSRLELGDDESRIPTLVIQRPAVDCSHESHNYNCHMDVIIPSGWGLAFWLAFVYRGGRASGLREIENTTADSSQFVFPRHFPDTNAGIKHAQEHRAELTEILYRKPPSKRTPYNAMGILAPFHCPWTELITDWSNGNDHELLIIRTKDVLQKIKNICDSEINVDNTELNEVEIPRVALVCIKFKMLNKGVPAEFSVICLPSCDDLKMLRKNEHYEGPVENVDHNDVRDEYIKQLKQRGKSYKPAIRELQKLKDVKNVKDCCTRTCIGYVIHGGYNFCIGSGAGLAMCVLDGLLKNAKYLLIRSPSSRQYRFASFSIVTG
ncbi:ribonucleases P/MRP protein subunit POP1-like [Tubulanus polymorphus]|uniref:ribonucleases P/MRP protein subunit POP1-like n=1 Tax=Tubulanus polymorphus TaxID=672921 RepID=UPI003DA274E4